MSAELLHFLDTCPVTIRSTFAIVEFLPGAFLLTQGEAPRHVFILEDGEASVYLLTANGIQYLEYIYTGDELFGEVEVLNSQPVLCNVVARSKCRVIRVEKANFWGWIQADPAFALFITRQLADKFYRACQAAITQIAYPLRYRMLFFVWQATQQGSPYIRKDDVVSGLGSNERSVNRIIKDLVEAGLFEYDRGMLKILSKEAVIKEMSWFE